jgi:hypothetical protein
LEIEQLAFDRRGNGPYQVLVTRSAEHLADEEASPLDPEEHAADSTGSHRFYIDPLRQHSHLSSSDQRHIAGLVQHGLPDGEEDDHDSHPEGKTQEQEEGTELPDQ